MPIYAYRCSSCGFQNDYLQKVSDAVLTQCPQCANETFNKMLTAPGFQLKGSGWYATDFKNSGAKPAAAATATASEGSKPDSGDSSKSDSTAAAAHSCGAGACSTCS